MTRPWRSSAYDALRRTVWLDACILFTVAVSACVAYPNSDERFNDEVVATAYDKKVDFSHYKTFSIDPEVHVVKNGESGILIQVPLDPQYADPIIAQIVKNMKDKGYEQVDHDKKPDLGLTVTGIDTTVTGYYSAYWGYGGYWGYPGYGYYYPYYYSYSYRAGSLITEMADLTKPPTGGGSDDDAGTDGGKRNAEGLEVVWSSIGYQVLESSASANLNWAKNSVDQAFAQSPYLGRK
jgi:hypothetical protein